MPPGCVECGDIRDAWKQATEKVLDVILRLHVQGRKRQPPRSRVNRRKEPWPWISPRPISMVMKSLFGTGPPTEIGIFSVRQGEHHFWTFPTGEFHLYTLWGWIDFFFQASRIHLATVGRNALLGSRWEELTHLLQREHMLLSPQSDLRTEQHLS